MYLCFSDDRYLLKLLRSLLNFGVGDNLSMYSFLISSTPASRLSKDEYNDLEHGATRTRFTPFDLPYCQNISNYALNVA
jgi:hypothetical protein